MSHTYFNVDLHDALRSNIKQKQDIYAIIPCVTEDFAKLMEYDL